MAQIGVPVAAEAPKEARNYQTWSQKEEDLVLDWLEKPGNYKKWKCSGQKTENRGTATSGRTKKSMSEEIAKYLVDNGQRERNHKMIKDKIGTLEKNWRTVSDWLGSTGAGVDEEKMLDRDGKLKIATIKDAVIQKCRLFDRLDVLCFERPSNNPAFVADTRDGEEPVAQILFGQGAAVGAVGNEEPDRDAAVAVVRAGREAARVDENSGDEEEPNGQRGRNMGNKTGKQKEEDKKAEKNVPLSFTKMMVQCEKEKTERFKMQQETVKRKAEMDAEHQKRLLVLQERELDIRQLEARNHRLMLQLRAGNHDVEL